MMRLSALALLCWGVTATALAAPRVVVGGFEGPGSDRVRGAVEEAVADGAELVPLSEVAGAEREAGVSTDTPEGRVAVARALSVSAFVEGRVEGRARRKLTLVVYDGSDGRQLGEASIAGRRKQLVRRVRARAWGELEPLVARGSAPEPEPESEELPVDDGQDEGGSAPVALSTDDLDDEGDGEGPADMLLSLGFGLGARDYDYPEAGNLGGLPGYALKPWADPIGIVPSLHVGLRAHMSAMGVTGLAGGLGLDLAYDQVFGIDSEDAATGQTYETSASSWHADLRMRFPVGVVLPALFVGYGGRSFEVEREAAVPAVAYQDLRAGGDLRVELSQLSLEVRAGVLLPLAFGGIAGEGWYPEVGGLGLTSHLQLGWAPIDYLEPFLRLGYDRYGLTFDPQPGSQTEALGRVAGGALDQYFQALLGVALRL